MSDSKTLKSGRSLNVRVATVDLWLYLYRESGQRRVIMAQDVSNLKDAPCFL